MVAKLIHPVLQINIAGDGVLPPRISQYFYRATAGFSRDNPIEAGIGRKGVLP